jgi:hypothetical protein
VGGVMGVLSESSFLMVAKVGVSAERAEWTMGDRSSDGYVADTGVLRVRADKAGFASVVAMVVGGAVLNERLDGTEGCAVPASTVVEGEEAGQEEKVLGPGCRRVYCLLAVVVKATRVCWWPQCRPVDTLKKGGRVQSTGWLASSVRGLLLA